MLCVTPRWVSSRSDVSNLSAADAPQQRWGMEEFELWCCSAQALCDSGVLIATKRTADVSAKSETISVPMAACARALDRRPRCLRLVPDGHEVTDQTPLLQSCIHSCKAVFVALLIGS